MAFIVKLYFDQIRLAITELLYKVRPAALDFFMPSVYNI